MDGRPKSPYLQLRQAWKDNNWRFACDHQRQVLGEELAGALNATRKGGSEREQSAQESIVLLEGIYGIGKSSLFNKAFEVSHDQAVEFVDFHENGQYYSAKNDVIKERLKEYLRQAASSLYRDEDPLLFLDMHLLYKKDEQLFVFRVATESLDGDVVTLLRIVHNYHQKTCVEMRYFVPPTDRPSPGPFPRDESNEVREAFERLPPFDSLPRMHKSLYAFNSPGVSDLCCVNSNGSNLHEVSQYGNVFRRPNFPCTQKVVDELQEWTGRHPFLLHRLCFWLDEHYGHPVRKNGEDSEDLRSVVQRVFKERKDDLMDCVQKLCEALPSEWKDELHELCNGRPGKNLELLDDCGLLYQSKDGPAEPPKLVQEFFKSRKGEPKNMDQQTLQFIAIIGSWLAPFVMEGWKGFAKGVGEGLGKSFEGRVWKLLERVPDAANASQRAELEQRPSDHRDLIGELLLEVAEDHPEEASAVGEHLWPALAELLTNDHFFSGTDVKERLIPRVYNPQESKYYRLVEVERDSFDATVNTFLEQVKSDGALLYLTKRIQIMKPRLFEQVE